MNKNDLNKLRFDNLNSLRKTCDYQEIGYNFDRQDIAWLFSLAQKEITKEWTKTDYICVTIMAMITTVLTVGTIHAILTGFK